MTLAHRIAHPPFGWNPTQQFVAAVSALAVVAVGRIAHDTTLAVAWIVPAVLVCLFAASEVFVAHVEYRRNAHTLSFVELPLVIGLLAAPSAVLIVAHAIGGAAALVLHRRQRPIKLLFNLSTFVLQDALAIFVFRAFNSTAPGDSRTSIGLVVACVAASVLSIVLVQAVMWVDGDHPSRRDALAVASLGVTVTAFTSALGVATVVMWEHDRVVTLMIVPAIIGAFLAQKVQVGSIVRRRYLAAIDASLAYATRARSSDELVDELLARARDTLGARRVSLVRTSAHEAAVRSCTDDGEPCTTNSESASTWAWLSSGMRAGSNDPLVFVERRVARHRAAMDADAAAAAVRVGAHTGSFLVAFAKRSDVGRYERDDLDFLQLVSHQIDIAVTHGPRAPIDEVRLLELELNHRVRRDALTGLANDLGLIERLSSFTGTSEDVLPAIVAISFGADRDSVGADDLALVVSQRLTGALRSRDTLARWADDLFVATVAPHDGVDEAGAVAGRLLDRLSTSVNVAGDVRTLDVRIGICRSGGGDPITVVQKAVAACSTASPFDPVVMVTP